MLPRQEVSWMTGQVAHRVSAPDGTQIAYWTVGTGSAIVLVHGTTSDHTTYDELIPHVARWRTVVSFDRRGRGQSGDGGASYDVEREFEDLAALVDEVAAQQAAPVDVFGHSFGAFVALGGALRTTNVRAVVAYSPGFGAEYPPGSLDQIEAATAADDRDEVLQVMFREVIGMPDDEVQAMRRSPVWQRRQAAAGTIGRECRADESFLRRYQSALGELREPVLVISGAKNPEPKRQIAGRLADLVPAASLYEMPGQGHVAHHFAPEELTRTCLRFFDTLDARFAASTSDTFP
jgi:pimeloyl-ACP methyl ester carboxylesterase